MAASETLDGIAILVCASDWQDIAGILRQHRVPALPIHPDQLREALRQQGAAAAVIGAEMLAHLDIGSIEERLRHLSAASDFPFILLMDRAFSADLPALRSRLGNLVLLERPLVPSFLINCVEAALRTHARQVQLEEEMRLREAAGERLREVTETLEVRVRQRMQELASANERLRRDREERQATQEMLRESEELYRYTLELSRHIVWTADPEGAFLTMSPRFTEVTGGTAATPPEHLIHPEDVGGVMTAWTSAVASGRPHHVEFRMRAVEGSYRMFRSRAAPRRDESGRIIRWYGFTEDIEDQKQEHAARLQAEERYRLAARATNDAIWDGDLQTGQIHWSECEGGIFGHRHPASTPFDWWAEKVHPEDRDQVTNGFDAALAGDQDRWSGEYRFLDGEGAYVRIFDRCFIIRDRSGAAIRAVGAMADVTERRQAEAELRRLQGELIHISRVSAMGTMASTLAHELNQPLTAVSSYISGSRRLLETPGGSYEQAREALLAAESAALRGGQILRRLREFVARGNVAVRPEKLLALVQEACDLGFVDQHRLGVTHKVKIDAACGWVTADRVQIQQVLINLIRNAIQAMEGARVKQVTIRSACAPGDMVEISVMDTGPGIAPEARKALFSPFQSTKLDGMGIGLSISRTIVEAHGGKIWADDRSGGGAVFRFTLPRGEGPRDS